MDPLEELKGKLVEDIAFILEVEGEEQESLFEIQPPASVRRAAAEAAAAVLIAYERGYRMEQAAGA